MKTIKLTSDLCGEQEYTKEEYVTLWTDTAGQLMRLADDKESFAWATKIKIATKERAGRMFDKLYEEQNSAAPVVQ